MSLDTPRPENQPAPPDVRVAIVAARFNASIVDELLRGCTARLGKLGVTPERVHVFRVPGAFELPSAVAMVVHTGRFDAIIALGCVIRGQTPHFDFVAGEAARGIATLGMVHRMPVIFGVLTTNTRKQATDRAGGPHGHAGISAADAAVEMLRLRAGLPAPTPPKLVASPVRRRKP